MPSFLMWLVSPTRFLLTIDVVDEADEEDDEDDEEDDEDEEEVEGDGDEEIPSRAASSRHRVIFERTNGEAAAITNACTGLGGPPPFPARSTRSHSSPCIRMSSMQARRVAAWLGSLATERTVAWPGESPLPQPAPSASLTVLDELRRRRLLFRREVEVDIAEYNRRRF